MENNYLPKAERPSYIKAVTDKAQKIYDDFQEYSKKPHNAKELFEASNKALWAMNELAGPGRERVPQSQLGDYFKICKNMERIRNSLWDVRRGAANSLPKNNPIYKLPSQSLLSSKAFK